MSKEPSHEGCALAFTRAPDTTEALLALCGALEGRWLDLGCGQGETVALLRERGVDALGVDKKPFGAATDAGGKSDCDKEFPLDASSENRGAADCLLGADAKKRGAACCARDIDAPPRVLDDFVIGGDMLALPFEDGELDGCVAECSLSVCGGAAAALREAARVTKSGGALLVSDVYFKSPEPPSLSLGAPATLARWRELISLAGYDIVCVADASEAWRGYITRLIWEGAESSELFGGTGVKGAGYFLAYAKKRA